VSGSPYQDDRGNKDRSITKDGGGTLSAAKNARRSSQARVDEPFLIGDVMTGGYGKGPDILHSCTIAAEKGEIAVIVGPNGAGKSTAMKALFGML